MTDAVVEAPKPEREGQIASWLHLLIVVGVMTLGAYRGSVNATAIAEAKTFNRAIFYVIAIAFEWAMLGIVLLGLRLHHTPLSTVLGERWKSIREVARDIGIAVAFLIVSSFVLSVTAGHPRDTAPGGIVQAILPHGPVESILWIGLSVSAGICEEAIFRGYLQRQFIALTGSSAVGILLSAVVFGFGHAYKGVVGALQITVFGVLFGILAYWRRSLRPGMIAHTLTDSFAGVMAGLLKIKVS
ncbi:MAG: CPBP family intramembrane glutamic endopeptidase [Gemmatimonadaceae bacterium]